MESRKLKTFRLKNRKRKIQAQHTHTKWVAHAAYEQSPTCLKDAHAEDWVWESEWDWVWDSQLGDQLESNLNLEHPASHSPLFFQPPPPRNGSYISLTILLAAFAAVA